MKRIKINLLSNISRLTTKTKVVGGLIGLGLSLGSLSLSSQSSQTTIKTFNQESLNSAFKSNLVLRKGISVSFIFPAIPLLAPVVFGPVWAGVTGATLGGIVVGGIAGAINDSRRADNQQKINEIDKKTNSADSRITDLEGNSVEIKGLLQENNSLKKQIKKIQEENQKTLSELATQIRNRKD